MDRDLLRQCLTYHGESLLNKLKCEQTENPDFQVVVSDLCKATYERCEGQSCHLVEQFIARKADILFSPAWRTAMPHEEQQDEEDTSEPCAIMPPLELFMEVSFEERRAMLYRDLERGDIVVGRINNIREYGFFLTLLCTAGGLKRDIEDLELSALCHIREIPSTGSHDNPLSYYQIGDLIRAGVKDIDRYQEKITVSVNQSSLFPHLENTKLGVISQEELPVHYSRSVRVASDTNENYECLLRSCHGYHNPSVVDYLLEKVGVSDTKPPSLMRGLQSELFEEDDFAAPIRKKQSASWALKCVCTGVDHFKHGRHVEAMNEYNKALDIDTNNVEALVARGALYANKGGIMKAIADFELALESCPDHRNAKKYLCQTLVERGKLLEEQDKLVTAEGLYRRALALDDSNSEAQGALNKITDTIKKSICLREEALAKEQDNPKCSQSSAEKLRKILKEEKRIKRKRKRSSSSSSYSSRNSSSSSFTHRKSKKRKKKKKRSERGSKRHHRVSSRESRKREDGEREKDKKESDEEFEWYPAPPNTSATFLNQKALDLRETGETEDRIEERNAEDRRISRLYSLSTASDDGESDSSQKRRRRKSCRDESSKSVEKLSRSPERSSGGRRHEKRDTSNDRGRVKSDRGSNDLKRSSLDETRGQNVSSSSSESNVRVECSMNAGRNSGFASKHCDNRPNNDYLQTKKSSLGDGRYESSDHEKIWKGKSEQRTRSDGRPEKCLSTPLQDAETQKQSSDVTKSLPTNLLDIFNQIAQFEKQKGLNLKK